MITFFSTQLLEQQGQSEQECGRTWSKLLPQRGHCHGNRQMSPVSLTFSVHILSWHINSMQFVLYAVLLHHLQWNPDRVHVAHKFQTLLVHYSYFICISNTITIFLFNSLVFNKKKKKKNVIVHGSFEDFFLLGKSRMLFPKEASLGNNFSGICIKFHHNIAVLSSAAVILCALPVPPIMLHVTVFLLLPSCEKD